MRVDYAVYARSIIGEDDDAVGPPASDGESVRENRKICG
jgi:hypothetical protein